MATLARKAPAILAHRLADSAALWATQPITRALGRQGASHAAWQVAASFPSPLNGQEGLAGRLASDRMDWVAFAWKPEALIPSRRPTRAGVIAHARRLIARERARMRRGVYGGFSGRPGERVNRFGRQKGPGLHDSGR